MSVLEEEAREWFLKAEKDYESYLKLKESTFTFEPALFHAQQAIEKWYKGIATYNNIFARKTHRLITLHTLLKDCLPELDQPKWLRYCGILEQYAVDARYPGFGVEDEELVDDITLATEALVEFRSLVLLNFPNLVAQSR
jgi:HEPN domain-containing protein